MKFEIPLSFNALPHQNYIRSKINKYGHIVHYKMPKFRQYQEYIGYVAKSAMNREGWEYCNGDFEVKIKFIFNNKNHGDMDNCEKSLMDALQGVLFKDDKYLRKKYVEYSYGREAKIFVSIEKLC